MKRASYRAGVFWIAANDNAGSNDNEADVAGYVSTILLADLFDASLDRVAQDIMRARDKYLATVTNHPNRNWRRQWTVEIERHEARHVSGLVVRFRAVSDGWVVDDWQGKCIDPARRLSQAREVFLAAMRAGRK
jgi:hypothetical protein